MTHTGGKPHQVGDRGQRYVVSVYDESQNKRIDVAYTDSAMHASDMATGAHLRPSWKFAWVTDRRPEVTYPNPGSQSIKERE